MGLRTVELAVLRLKGEKICQDLFITTIVGIGGPQVNLGDNGPASDAQLSRPHAVLRQ